MISDDMFSCGFAALRYRLVGIGVQS